jgi:hypothetical protein
VEITGRIAGQIEWTFNTEDVLPTATNLANTAAIDQRDGVAGCMPTRGLDLGFKRLTEFCEQPC